MDLCKLRRQFNSHFRESYLITTSFYRIATTPIKFGTVGCFTDPKLAKISALLQFERMAGKRAQGDESPKDDRPDEPGREGEDALPEDDEDNPSTAMEIQTDSAKIQRHTGINAHEAERQHVGCYAIHEHNAIIHFKACELPETL